MNQNGLDSGVTLRMYSLCSTENENKLKECSQRINGKTWAKWQAQKSEKKKLGKVCCF